MSALWVFLGGGLGALLRFLAGKASVAWFGAAFPWGTLLVNVTGSLAIGLAIGWLAGTSADMRLFLVTGVLGGYTTFSAFSLDALALWQRGEPGMAALYVLASVALSLAAVAAGYALSRA